MSETPGQSGRALPTFLPPIWANGGHVIPHRRAFMEFLYFEGLIHIVLKCCFLCPAIVVSLIERDLEAWLATNPVQMTVNRH
jgi:hypothetical protein